MYEVCKTWVLKGTHTHTVYVCKHLLYEGHSV